MAFGLLPPAPSNLKELWGSGGREQGSWNSLEIDAFGVKK